MLNAELLKAALDELESGEGELWDIQAARRKIEKHITDLGSEVERLKTRLSNIDWQPVETAPKDGTLIDLWFGIGGREADCRWNMVRNWWERRVADESFKTAWIAIDIGPTHWRPLTQPSKP